MEGTRVACVDEDMRARSMDKKGIAIPGRVHLQFEHVLSLAVAKVVSVTIALR